MLLFLKDTDSINLAFNKNSMFSDCVTPSVPDSPVEATEPVLNSAILLVSQPKSCPEQVESSHAATTQFWFADTPNPNLPAEATPNISSVAMAPAEKRRTRKWIRNPDYQGTRQACSRGRVCDCQRNHKRAHICSSSFQFHRAASRHCQNMDNSSGLTVHGAKVLSTQNPQDGSRLEVQSTLIHRLLMWEN